jgi:TP901 family phage tail tape measure protein
MKEDPLKLVDSEGEAMDYNKVDKALKSVGISLKDDNNQFRDMTSVILELSEVWDKLDSTQQRYIATQFAGNRQQSRFLALIGNEKLLKANLGYAEDSEGVGDLQVSKALDGIEARMNKLKAAYEKFYMTLGIEDTWKSLITGATNYLNILSNVDRKTSKFITNLLGGGEAAEKVGKIIGKIPVI